MPRPSPSPQPPLVVVRNHTPFWVSLSAVALSSGSRGGVLTPPVQVFFPGLFPGIRFGGWNECGVLFLEDGDGSFILILHLLSACFRTYAPCDFDSRLYLGRARRPKHPATEKRFLNRK